MITEIWNILLPKILNKNLISSMNVQFVLAHMGGLRGYITLIHTTLCRDPPLLSKLIILLLLNKHYTWPT